MPLADGMPDFLHFETPRETVRIRNNGERYYPEGEPEMTFEFPSGAYNYIREKLGKEAVFTREDISLHDPDENGESHFSARTYFEPMSHQILMSYDPNFHQKMALDTYKEFLGLKQKYEENPEDFYTAYEFMSWHPLFWSYSENSKGYIFWDYEGCFRGENPLSVYRSEESNEIRYLIEPTYPDNHKHGSMRVLDVNLVVSSNSYESAVIKAAERLNRFYDETGTARENVPDTEYTQQLHEELDKAQAEYDERHAAKLQS